MPRKVRLEVGGLELGGGCSGGSGGSRESVSGFAILLLLGVGGAGAARRIWMELMSIRAMARGKDDEYNTILPDGDGFQMPSTRIVDMIRRKRRRIMSFGLQWFGTLK